jgi:hypothetical protein
VQDIDRFLELGHVHNAERTGGISYPNLVGSDPTVGSGLKSAGSRPTCTMNNPYPACRRANPGKAAKSRRAVPRKRIGFISRNYTNIRICLQSPRTPKAGTADQRSFVDMSLVQELESSGFIRQLYKK